MKELFEAMKDDFKPFKVGDYVYGCLDYWRVTNVDVFTLDVKNAGRTIHKAPKEWFTLVNECKKCSLHVSGDECENCKQSFNCKYCNQVSNKNICQECKRDKLNDFYESPDPKIESYAESIGEKY